MAPETLLRSNCGDTPGPNTRPQWTLQLSLADWPDEATAIDKKLKPPLS
jgi:hypothetical protein